MYSTYVQNIEFNFKQQKNCLFVLYTVASTMTQNAPEESRISTTALSRRVYYFSLRTHDWIFLETSLPLSEK